MALKHVNFNMEKDHDELPNKLECAYCGGNQEGKDYAGSPFVGSTDSSCHWFHAGCTASSCTGDLAVSVMLIHMLAIAHYAAVSSLGYGC